MCRRRVAPCIASQRKRRARRAWWARGTAPRARDGRLLVAAAAPPVAHFFDFRQYQNPNPTPMHPSSSANQSEPRNEDASASMAYLLLGMGASKHDAYLAAGAERGQERDEQEDRCLVGGHFLILWMSVYRTAPTTMTAPPMET